jgi:hypothetical protein
VADPVSTGLFGVKLTIAQGAAAGSAIAFLLSEGTWRQKAAAAGVGALFSIYATEGALELLGRFITVTDATQRLGGLVFGIVGIICAQTLMKGAGRFRDRSGDLVDGVVEKKTVTLTKETTKVVPNNPPVADAPASDIPGAPTLEKAG